MYSEDHLKLLGMFPQGMVQEQSHLMHMCGLLGIDLQSCLLGRSRSGSHFVVCFL